MKFDSNLEKQRYFELYAKQSRKEISDLDTQYGVDIYINQRYICTYTIDFVYWSEGKLIAEETKGYFHEQDKLRFKLFLAYATEFDQVFLQNTDEKYYPVRLSEKGKIQLYREGKWKLYTKKSTRKSAKSKKGKTRRRSRKSSWSGW